MTPLKGQPPGDRPSPPTSPACSKSSPSGSPPAHRPRRLARRGLPDWRCRATGELLELYRRLVTARRFDRLATTLTRQGRLAVYPSAGGQEACQVGAVLALRPQDWMFPTYRETVALITRGIPAVEALSLLRGELALRLRPATVADGAAVHAAGDAGVARGRIGLRCPAQGRGHGRARLPGRRRHERGRRQRRLELRRRLRSACRLLHPEQPVRHQRPALQADEVADPRPPCPRLRHRRLPRGRQRRRGRAGDGVPAARRGP